jgi:xylulokinase
VQEPGDACVLLGSTLVIGCAVAEPVACPGLEVSRYPGGGYFLGGWTATAGLVLDWFRREFGDVDDARPSERGASNLLALPYFDGERTPIWDPSASGIVAGLTLDTTREELYLALVDGIALSARDHLELLASIGQAPTRWRASGGGTQDEAWLGATSDALGAPLDVVAHAERAVGPAVLAFRTLGVDVSLPVVREVVPDAARGARFDALYAAYRELYRAAAPVMHLLAATES